MSITMDFRGARDVIPWRPKVFRTDAAHVFACGTSARRPARIFAKDFREPREDFPRFPELAFHA